MTFYSAKMGVGISSYSYIIVSYAPMGLSGLNILLDNESPLRDIPNLFYSD